MLRKKMRRKARVQNASLQRSWSCAHGLPEPERIVGLGFRYWLRGWKTCDIASWEQAWQLYCGLFGTCAAHATVDKLSCWVSTIHRAAAREIDVGSTSDGAFCRDECVAIAMIAACQHHCPAVRACAFALIDTSSVDRVVEHAHGFAQALMSLDQILSPASIVPIPALVPPAGTQRH
jgi:hypothetical protein